ncbi:aldo/keto reductase [Actinopolymorpha singaporensis]
MTSATPTPATPTPAEKDAVPAPLRTRPLGRSGIRVSEIGLGAWQLGARREWAGPDEEESYRIIDEAVRLGCTFIDTASPYADGRSEEYIGRALEGRRDQVVLCTKFGFWAPGYQEDHSPDRIEEALELSLTRLRTDYLDVALIHSPPYELMDGRTVAHYRILQRLLDAGTIRAYGVADRASNADELRRIVHTTGSSVLETNINVLEQHQLDVIAEAAEAGVGVVVRTPLASGWLSGKYDRDSDFPNDDRRVWWTRAQVREKAAAAQRFRALVPEGTTMTHAALRFLLAQPEISTVIPGAKSVEQLRHNVAAAQGTLPAATVAAIRDFGRRPATEQHP